MTPFEFLQAWYRSRCGGDWEHAHGVTIETLDNPGWMVTVDLFETPLDGRPMTPVRKERSDSDWLVCEVDHNQFRGQGDVDKLPAILQVFADWAAKPAKVE
jgi:hypothetical protein